jgi:hypothetical protein
MINKTLKVKARVTPEQALKSEKGNRDTPINIRWLYLCARRGFVINPTHRPLYPRQKDSIPIVQEAGWAPGPVRTIAKNLAPVQIRSTDPPLGSEYLYQLSCGESTVLFKIPGRKRKVKLSV